MQQSIVVLIRPKLNFAQKEDQAAHLIEHLLVDPKRLEAMGISADFYAKNIIHYGGSVNDFYLAEYYIVKPENADHVADILWKHQNELYTTKDGFEKIKSALIQEVNESRGEVISLGEQLAKAVYETNSPSTRNSWNTTEALLNISHEKTNEIFKKYNTNISLLNLSFYSYKVDKLPVIERNKLRNNTKNIELTHPWQSLDSVDTKIFVHLPEKSDLLTSLLYRRSLTDTRFGLLYGELRIQRGLLYDITVTADYNDNTFEIYFASSEENSKEVINYIKNSLEKYDSFIINNLPHLKERLKIELELDWGDVQNTALSIVNQVISGGYTEPELSLIKRMASVTADNLSEFNRSFLALFNQEALLVKRHYGESATTEVIK